MTTTGFVEDYAELRSPRPHAFNIVLVRNRDATKTLMDSTIPPRYPILNPRGLFVWDDESTDKDNDITVITPSRAVAKGRWKRAYYSEYDRARSIEDLDWVMNTFMRND